MKTTRIVWNGCDGYVEADDAVRLGYNFDGEKLYHKQHSYSAFDVEEIDQKALPVVEDGEPDYTGVFASESGRFYVVKGESK